VSVIENESVEHAAGRDAPSPASRADLMAARRSLRVARARQRRRRFVRRSLLPLCAIVALGTVVAILVSSTSAGPKQHASRAARSSPTAAKAGATSSTSPAPVTRAAQGGVGAPGAPLPAPSAAAPLRMLVVGDGLADDVGTQLASELAPGRLVDVTVDGHPGSGLVRTTPIDWFATLLADLAQSDPELVVVVLGSNDREPIATSSSTTPFGSSSWLAAYEGLARRFAQEAAASGARVLWLGMPPMSSATTTAAMREVDGVYQDVAVSTPGVVYLASWPLLSTPDGLYAATLQGASGPTTVRTADGQRLTPAGAAIVSQAVVDAVDASWNLHLRV